MCVQICFATRVALSWNPARGTITVPRGLSTVRTMVAVRTVLTELGAEQPAVGALCWCGEPVEVWRGRHSNRRDEVRDIGA